MAMKRIMVIGPPGAGKSTFARDLAARLGLPVFHLDEHYFLPNWVWPADEDFEKTVAKLVKTNKTWVMDGNYSASMRSRIAKADTLIFLDLPLSLRLWRSFLRFLRHKTEPRLGLSPHVTEKFDWYFIRLHWLWTKKFRKKWLDIAAKNPRIRFYHLTDT